LSKNANFFAKKLAKIAEDCQTLPPIVIITSTPGNYKKFSGIFSPKIWGKSRLNSPEYLSGMHDFDSGLPDGIFSNQKSRFG
jgi:hypothetical protein